MPVLKGFLFPNHYVKLVHETPEWGGSWLSPARGGQAMVYDQGLLRFTYERLAGAQLMIDIGANTGSFSLLPALIPGLRCISFEPQPGPCNVLLQNIELNELQDRVTVHRMGLSDTVGQATLWQPPRKASSGLSSCKKRSGWNPIVIPVVTLDTFCLPRADLVKLDVEGWELRVLKGAAQYLADVQPALLIEYKHVGLKTITGYLAQIGYSWLDLENARDLYAWKRPAHSPEAQ